MFIILLISEGLAIILFFTVMIKLLKKETIFVSFPPFIIETRRKLALNIAYVKALRNELTESVKQRLVKFYK